MFKSLWEDNWKELDQVHQQFLQAIVKNNPVTFVSILDRKNSSTPIDINYRYQSNWTPIHYAAMNSTIQILSRLINHPRIDINALTNFGDTPLHIAVKSNKLENTLLLLSAGVCIDKRDNDLNTALHYACELSYQSIAESLIEHGACYELANHNGMTAVDLAPNQLKSIFPNLKAS
jgi:ankyrin repeat protein